MTISIPTLSLGASWVPKIGALLGVFNLAVGAAPDNAPGAHYIKPWLPSLNALAVALVGFSARQNNKTSEDVGATKPAAAAASPAVEPPKP